jgi:hypothetical protein
MKFWPMLCVAIIESGINMFRVYRMTSLPHWVVFLCRHVILIALKKFIRHYYLLEGSREFFQGTKHVPTWMGGIRSSWACVLRA